MREYRNNKVFWWYHIFIILNHEGGVRMGEYDVKHDGCDALSWCRLWWLYRRWKRGTEGTYFHEREVERIRQETIQICYTWGGGGRVDGVGGEVMFFNTTRSHAMVIGQVLLVAWHCRPNCGLLFSNQYHSSKQHQETLDKSKLRRGPPQHLVHCGKQWHRTRVENIWMSVELGYQGMFFKVYLSPSLDTNTIPSSHDSTSSLQQYYQHKESLFLLMLCNHYL